MGTRTCFLKGCPPQNVETMLWGMCMVSTQKNPKHVLPKNVHTGAPAWKECHTTCNIAVPSSCEPTTRRNRLEHNTLCGQWQKPSGNDGVGHLGRNTVVGFSSGHERFGSIDRCYVPTVLSCVGAVSLDICSRRNHTCAILMAPSQRRRAMAGQDLCPSPLQ